jgi:hypothetical protein
MAKLLGSHSNFMREHVIETFVITSREKVPLNYGFIVMDTEEHRDQVVDTMEIQGLTGRQLWLQKATARKKRQWSEVVGGDRGSGAAVQAPQTEVIVEAVDRMIQQRYHHLANPRQMRAQVEMAVEAKRPMFQAVVKAENKRLVATIAEYFNGIGSY